jgi:hypothetical protein
MNNENWMTCDICGKHETALSNHGNIKRLATDHDHQTGIQRGRLCMRCNVMLGIIENTEWIDMAKKYLKLDWEKENRIRQKQFADQVFNGYLDRE